MRAKKVIRSTDLETIVKHNPILLASMLAVSLFSFSADGMQQSAKEFYKQLGSSVVAVRVQKQIAGGGAATGLRQVLLNGLLVDSRIRPKIIKVVESNGIAYDKAGRIVSYLGNRWLALNPKEPGVRISLMRPNGRILSAKLLGIDQRSGIAVIQASGDLTWVPRTILSKTQAASRRDCYLVDVGARQPARRAGLRHATGDRETGYYLSDHSNPPQGQLLLTPKAELWGFVTGHDFGSDPDAPGEVQMAADLMASVERIIDGKTDVEAGWLGVYINDRSNPAGKHRVVVTGVVSHSPAELSGIVRGDVILKIDGVPIRNSRQFSTKIRWEGIGDRIRLKLQRNGNYLNVPVTISARRDQPNPAASAIYLQVSPGSANSAIPLIELTEVQSMGRVVPEADQTAKRPQLGIVADDLTPQLGDFFGVDGARGVLVVSVERGSLSDRFGLTAGDVITALNGDPVANLMNFSEVLATHGDDRTWVFQLVRDKKIMNLTVTP